MNRLKTFSVCFLSIILIISCQPEWIKKAPQYDYSGMDKNTRQVHQRVEKFLALATATRKPVFVHPATRIRKILIDEEARHIDIDLNKYFSFTPFRKGTCDLVYASLKKELGRSYRSYSVTLKTLEHPVEELVPNLYRPDASEYDRARMARLPEDRPLPLVRNSSKPWHPGNGLYGHNIALWHSHGWYYDQYANRWEWQRPRLFQTVEDVLPLSFTLPYIIPMLENAGANVFVPRERDIQTAEVIVDNDAVYAQSGMIAYSENRKSDSQRWFTGRDPAFGAGTPPYREGDNPFRMGSYRFTYADTAETAFVDWIPDIPETGDYAVYVSFVASDSTISDARYTVYHAGGRTGFLVNQNIGDRTWIYLGTFSFHKGFSAENGKVRLSNETNSEGKIVSADAVKFGGGMGVVAREGRISGRPKFLEASRYYLQSAGFPDSIVYSLTGGKADYTDDYQSRPEYVNYLRGAPFGPNKNRTAKGLGIPIDLSLAFHTDAGITRNDTTIGTLSIYSVEDAETLMVFPDQVSRMANRDFADVLQTQLVDDIRATFDPRWNRRALMDSKYSEAFRPNVPGSLLELLSHQNFLDMKFALDPRFRFTASRAIYKAMLKFITNRYDETFVVQPLPVTHFTTEFTASGALKLAWQPQTDHLEPSAVAEKYILYTRKGNLGFDNGVLVDGPELTLDDLEPGVIYSYKVTAVNRGGESFPSEILSVRKPEGNRKPVLIISGFDRVCGPYGFETESMSGFLSQLDNGVPDRYDLTFTGQQYDFNPDSPFRLNDAPGHGASGADFETRVIPGNTFDFAYVHGTSFAQAGYGFVSVSDEAVMDGRVDMDRYDVADLILGEEKETGWQRAEMDSLTGKAFKTFPEKLKREIRRFTDGGGCLLVSGAHVGSDLFQDRQEQYPDRLFAEKTLKFSWVTSHAARTGGVFAVGDSIFRDFRFRFNTDFHPHIYTVESPDAIAPVKGAVTILRYSENQFSAGIAYKGDYKVVVMGFPIETIVEPEDRDRLIQTVMRFFEEK